MKKEGKYNKELLKRVMYFHGETTDGYRFTIAGYVQDNFLHMGVSVCGDRDNFVKSKGRSIATTRLLSEKNNQNIGRYAQDIENQRPIENEFKLFTTYASARNLGTKKKLLKISHLNRHQCNDLPF